MKFYLTNLQRVVNFVLLYGATYRFYNFILTYDLLYYLYGEASRTVELLLDKLNNKFETPKFKKQYLGYNELGRCHEKVRKTGKCNRSLDFS